MNEELEFTVSFIRIQSIYSIVSETGQSVCTVDSLIKISNQLQEQNKNKSITKLQMKTSQNK